jgi:Alternative complex III, ActD subunit
MKAYGLLAEFATADALVAAVKGARAAGFTRIDAYSPFPVEHLDEALGFTRNRVPLMALIGALVGGCGTYLMQWYSAVIDYPLNIGGRPLHSWPSFIVPTFEITILGAALAAFFGMLLANGLPRLNHPIFNALHFEHATRNRFFICIEASDPHFDLEGVEAFLAQLQPLCIEAVPAE